MLIKEPMFPGTSELEQLNVLFKTFGTFNNEMLPGIEFFPNYNANFKQFKGVGLRKFILSKTQFEVDENALDLLERMLQIDPTKRITCKEALLHPFFAN